MAGGIHKVIDYSKWDSLAVSSSSSNSSNEEEDGSELCTGPSKGSTLPRVVKLETPSSVTITGNVNQPEISIHHNSTTSNKSVVTIEDECCGVDDSRYNCRLSDCNTFKLEEWTKSGGSLCEYVWRQDRYNVDASFFMPENIKAKDITVVLMDDGRRLKISINGVAYSNYISTLSVDTDVDTCHTELTDCSEDQIITNRHNVSAIAHVSNGGRGTSSSDLTKHGSSPLSCCVEVVDCELCYPVEHDEEKWLWEVVRYVINADDSGKLKNANRSVVLKTSFFQVHEQRMFNTGGIDSHRNSVTILHVYLKKKEVVQGLTIWWKSLFKTDKESQTAGITGRSERDIKMAKEVHDTWLQAQEAFVQKAKGRKKIPIDIQSDDDTKE